MKDQRQAMPIISPLKAVPIEKHITKREEWEIDQIRIAMEKETRESRISRYAEKAARGEPLMETWSYEDAIAEDIG